MVKRYDANKPEHQLKVGDEVWKLVDQVHGPYVVKSFEDLSKRTAIVEHKLEARDMQRAHVDRLYKRNQLPEGFEPDETWLEWTKNAAQDLTEEERKEIPEHMEARDLEELEPDEYEIEKIINHRTRKQKQGNKMVSKKQYLVRFKGYLPEEDKWIDEVELKETANKLVSDYQAKVEEEPGPKKKKREETRSSKKEVTTVEQPPPLKGSMWHEAIQASNKYSFTLY